MLGRADRQCTSSKKNNNPVFSPNSFNMIISTEVWNFVSEKMEIEKTGLAFSFLYYYSGVFHNNGNSHH